MNQTIDLNALSYELGVLMAMGYRKRDLAIHECANAMLLAISESAIDTEKLKSGIGNEMMTEEDVEPSTQAVLNVVADYYESGSALIREVIADVLESEEGTESLTVDAISLWASHVFSEVTDYEGVNDEEISFQQIGESLEGYRDLEQSNIESEINRQLIAAGYTNSVEDFVWRKK